MRNDNKFPLTAMFLCLFIGGALVFGIGQGLEAAMRHGEKHQAQQKIQWQKDSWDSLAHPEIVGTNDVGEVVKRYHVITEWGAYHTIYEIGTTRTIAISNGKFGIEVEATKTN